MALRGSATEPRMTRAAYELGAAIDGMEKAAQKILKCSEAIDENARTLAATLKTGYSAVSPRTFRNRRCAFTRPAISRT